MRRVVVQRENAAIDHRVAAEPVGDAPSESLAVILPGQGPAEQLRPLVVALVGAVDLGGDGQLVASGGGDIELDRPPVLQPGVRIDPQIHLVAGEMAPQERAGELGLAGFRGALAVRESRDPSRANEVPDPGRQPLALIVREPEIEDADRHVVA